MGLRLSWILAAPLLCCLSEADVEAQLEGANYCEAASECVVLHPGCPLGCYRLVNADEEAEMKRLIERYHSQERGSECVYDCVAIGEPRCEEERCVADVLDDL